MSVFAAAVAAPVDAAEGPTANADAVYAVAKRVVAGMVVIALA